MKRNSRMRALLFRIALPVLPMAISLEAQFPDRLYPFAELTDEMRAQIDLKDGSVDDWMAVLGEPSLTPLDFVNPHGRPGTIRLLTISASGWHGMMPPITCSLRHRSLMITT